MTIRPRKKKRKLRPGRILILFILLVFLSAAAATATFVADSLKDIPAWNSAALLSSNATLIYDRKGELAAKIGVENRTPVSINELPGHVEAAFLAAEDHRFYKHYGVDIKGILRAAYVDILHGGVRQGASTITQQLVKFSFLTPEQKMKRKIQEAVLAFQVEHYYSKKEILEMYLNKIYFGEGAHGIEAAAQTYFNKSARNVTLAEAAMLAGVIKGPSYYSPLAAKDTPEGEPHQSKSRQKLVLNLMAEYGYIDRAEADRSYAEPIQLAKAETKYPYPYFIDYVTELMVKKYGEELVYKTGLKVYTTLDPKIQTIAENVLADEKNFPPPKNNEKPQGAVVVTDPSNGEVKAIVGGREHTNRLSWNRATRNPGRQPGSSFKPIIAYGPAIDLAGMSPASIVDDAPVKYDKYEPGNFDKKYRGLITLRAALTSSVNIVAVKLLVEKVGIPQAINFAKGLGFEIDPRSVGASMALGTEEITPVKMAGAYGTFANQGIYNEPVVILKVEGTDGTVLEEYSPKPKRVMKAASAYILTDMLKSVIQAGTGTNANIGRPAAGKTGTTDEGKDIWFAGYTPELVGVVWVGYDQPTPMPQAFGGTYPAIIWKKIMSESLKGVPVQDFKRPEGIVTATVDSKSGLLPGPNTPTYHMVTDLFLKETVPTEVDNTHVLIDVCAASGDLPNEYCFDRVIRNLVSLPYTVDEKVADYQDRVPTEVCTLHGPESGTIPGVIPDITPYLPAPGGENSPGSIVPQTEIIPPH